MKLNKEFFSNKAEEVAYKLIGMKLARNLEGKILSGIISETESHTKEQKRTSKVEGAFAYPGTIHMYPSQGKYVLAIATEDIEKYSEVSIRALIPLKGIEEMKKYRKTKDYKILTNGPSRLVQALRITKDFEGSLIYNNCNLWIEKLQKGKFKTQKYIKQSKGNATDATSYFKLI